MKIFFCYEQSPPDNRWTPALYLREKPPASPGGTGNNRKRFPEKFWEHEVDDASVSEKKLAFTFQQLCVEHDPPEEKRDEG